MIEIKIQIESRSSSSTSMIYERFIFFFYFLCLNFIFSLHSLIPFMRLFTTIDILATIKSLVWRDFKCRFMYQFSIILLETLT